MRPLHTEPATVHKWRYRYRLPVAHASGSSSLSLTPSITSGIGPILEERNHPTVRNGSIGACHRLQTGETEAGMDDVAVTIRRYRQDGWRSDRPSPNGAIGEWAVSQVANLTSDSLNVRLAT